MDDSRYFVSLILVKTARGQVDDKGLVRLKAEYLKNVMNQKHYAAVVKALVDGEAVHREPYKISKRSYGYTLSERFIGDKHIRVPVKDTRLAHRLELFHEKSETERMRRMKPVHRVLEKHQRSLQIHGDEARRIIALLPAKSNPFDVQGILVNDIEQRNFHCNPGHYGRLTNSITSLKREVRQSLHVNRRRLSSVDISCCQPALIAQIMRTGTRTTRAATSIYDSTIAPPERGDFGLYRSLVQDGTFYEYMLDQMAQQGIHISREQLKKRFLADVIAKKKVNKYGVEYPSLVEDVFARLFPTVYHFIRRVNCDGWQHENLIRELQRQESFLVIETVCDDLMRRYPDMFLITLHDAILSTPGNVPRIEQAFHDAFERIGFLMKLKVSDQTNDNVHGYPAYYPAIVHNADVDRAASGKILAAETNFSAC